MNFLNNLSIGTRLALGSALVLVLTAVIAVVAQSGMSHQHDEIETIVRSDWAKNKLATTALDNTRGSIARVFQIVQESDKAGTVRPRRASALRPMPEDLQQSLNQLAPLVHSEEGKAQLAKCKESAERYLVATERVFALLDAGNRDAAGKLAYGETYTALHTLAADLRAFNDLQQQRLEGAAARSTASAERGRMLIIALGAIALLLGAASSWLVTHSVTSPMRQAIDAANRVKDGDLTVAIQRSGRDETAEMLAAMNEMVTPACARSRRRSAPARLGHHRRRPRSPPATTTCASAPSSRPANLQQTAASMEQLTGTVQQNADNARKPTSWRLRRVQRRPARRRGGRPRGRHDGARSTPARARSPTSSA